MCVFFGVDYPLAWACFFSNPLFDREAYFDRFSCSLCVLRFFVDKIEALREMTLPDLYRVKFCPDGSRFVLDPSGHDEAGMYVSPPEQMSDHTWLDRLLSPRSI